MKPVLGEEMLYHELNANSVIVEIKLLFLKKLIIITIIVIITTTIIIRKGKSGKIPGFKEKDRKIVGTQNGRNRTRSDMNPWKRHQRI